MVLLSMFSARITVSLNSIYFRISINTWQHTSIQYMENGLENMLLKTYINYSPSPYLKCKRNSVGIGLFNSKVKMSGELLLY